jgi:hypothetical protein
MKNFNVSILNTVQVSLLTVVLIITGCGSTERYAKGWVGQPIQNLMEASRHGETKKADELPNGHWVYITSDYAVKECKTYWEVDEQNIIVGFRYERGSWKCD